DAAASMMDTARPQQSAPWNERALSRRFLLAVALVLIAAAGLPVTNAVLASLGHPAHRWLALVWQISTLLGWIALTRAVLSVRAAIMPPSETDAVSGPRPRDVVLELGFTALLALV